MPTTVVATEARMPVIHEKDWARRKPQSRRNDSNARAMKAMLKMVSAWDGSSKTQAGASGPISSNLSESDPVATATIMMTEL